MSLKYLLQYKSLTYFSKYADVCTCASVPAYVQ